MRMMGKWEWLENDKVGAGQTNVQPETYHFWLKENLEMRMDEINERKWEWWENVGADETTIPSQRPIAPET